MNPALLAALRQVLGEDGVLSGADVASRSAGWSRPDGLLAWALLRPRSTEEVSQALALCHAAGQSVITHGGLTGLVRGADTEKGDIVLSLERMRRIESIDRRARTATVQAGVTPQALQEAVAEADLTFPLDLGARGSCTLGGNAATNAGGNRVIRYGMMRSLVLGIEAVLADGSVIPALSSIIKNNAGYDLKQLFIGSEGTLGVITRLTLRLFERARSQDTALVAVDSFAAVTDFLKHIDQRLGGALSAFEVMWPDFYELVTTTPAKGRAPLPHGHPYYVLLESQGGDAAADAVRFESALEAALDKGMIADAAIARSQADRDAMWGLRDDVSQMLRFAPICSFDVSLPLAQMEAYVAELGTALTAQWPQHRCFTFGHLGDGNLHIIVAPGAGDSDTRRRVEDLVYQPLASIGGSISAEHGIGLSKKQHLHLSCSPQEIALMQTLKKALDPKGILNPGRVI